MLRLCTPCMHHDRGVHIHNSSDADLGHCQQSALESHTQSRATNRTGARKASIGNASPLLAPSCAF